MRTIFLGVITGVVLLFSGGCGEKSSVEIKTDGSERLNPAKPVICPACRQKSPFASFIPGTPGRRECPACHSQIPEVVLVRQNIAQM